MEGHDEKEDVALVRVYGEPTEAGVDFGPEYRGTFTLKAVAEFHPDGEEFGIMDDVLLAIFKAILVLFLERGKARHH